MEVRRLKRLGRRLRRRIGHLQPQAEKSWTYFELCKPAYRCVRLGIALSGFECATLMWHHYRRLRAVLAEIRSRQGAD